MNPGTEWEAKGHCEYRLMKVTRPVRPTLTTGAGYGTDEVAGRRKWCATFPKREIMDTGKAERMRRSNGILCVSMS